MIEEGYKRYACDRRDEDHADGKKPIEFMRDEDKRAGDWHVVAWVDVNGVQRKSTLCEECWKKWESISYDQRKETQKFMDD